MIPIAQRLGAFASGITLKQVPQAVAEVARRCIVDVFGVTLAGLDTETGLAAQRVATAAYGSGLCRIPVSACALPVAGAAQVLGTAAHVWDYDDTFLEGIVHGSAAVWSAVAAMSQLCGLSGRQTLEAYIAGVETEYALGGVVTNKLFYRGWWPTGVLGAVGAAAGAARALSLDATATTNAIAIAAAQAVGPRRLQGWPSKPWLCGRAAETGVLAALYAREGLTAPIDAFEHPFGFAALHNDGLLKPDALDDLGSRWRLVSPGVSLKLYPACSSMQAATEAVLEIMREHRLDAADVAAVRCEVTELVEVSLVYNNPNSVAEAQFSMPFAIACALKFGGFELQHLNISTLRDPTVRAMFPKVQMVRFSGILAGPAAERDYPEGAAVALTTTAGRSYDRMNGIATGMPGKPMPDAQLDRKFLNCAARSGISAPEASRLLESLRTIDSLRSMAAVFGSA